MAVAAGFVDLVERLRAEEAADAVAGLKASAVSKMSRRPSAGNSSSIISSSLWRRARNVIRPVERYREAPAGLVEDQADQSDTECSAAATRSADAPVAARRDFGHCLGCSVSSNGLVESEKDVGDAAQRQYLSASI